MFGLKVYDLDRRAAGMVLSKRIHRSPKIRGKPGPGTRAAFLVLANYTPAAKGHLLVVPECTTFVISKEGVRTFFKGANMDAVPKVSLDGTNVLIKAFEKH